MSKKIKYTEGSMGKYKLSDFKRVDKSFFPPPEELAKRMKNTKITISLSDDSVTFFKEEAKKHNVQYQRMIRQVLDDYVRHQKKHQG
jgi:predicted DNA binding CopG/RHH family protein